MNNLKKGRKIGDYSDFILAHQHMPATTGGLKPVQTHLALDKAVYEPLLITSAQTRYSSNNTHSKSPPAAV